MFEITINENKETVFNGEFDLGIVGTFKDEMVSVNFDIKNYLEEPDDEQYEKYSGYINPCMNEKEIGIGLTRYYKNKYDNIQNHIQEINERLLIHLFNDMIDTDFEFWIEDDGHPEFLIAENMPECDEDEIGDKIYEGLCEKFSDIFCDEECRLDCGEISIREFVSKNFLMIDLDKFIEGIYPTYMALGGYSDDIAFQCCSKYCNFGIACEATAVIRDDLKFEGWDNF